MTNNIFSPGGWETFAIAQTLLLWYGPRFVCACLIKYARTHRSPCATSYIRIIYAIFGYRRLCVLSHIVYLVSSFFLYKFQVHFCHHKIFTSFCSEKKSLNNLLVHKPQKSL